MIQDVFKNIYIVNLDSRSDKWQAVKQELERIGITNYKRFSAIKPNLNDYPAEYYNRFTLAGADHEKYKIGSLGCKLSHIEIIKNARNNNLENILIFEDDVIFREDAQNIFDRAMNQMPNDWQMIYFSGHHRKPFKLIADNVAKIYATYTTHGYVIRNSLYDIIIEKALISGKELDVFYATEIHPFYNCYCIRPPILWQAAGFSDILQGYRNYKVLQQ